MSSARGATTAAIVSGAFVGTLAALLSGPPAPDAAPTRSDVTTVMAAGSAPAPEPTLRGAATRPPTASTAAASRVPAPAPSAAPKSSAPETRVAADEGNELDRLAVAELEKRCAFRQPAACLASARAFEAGRGIRPDTAKARLYRSLALSLLDERCVARDAQACHDLSWLHERGLGVRPSPETAAALRRRALELCAGARSPFCDRLGTSPSGIK